MENDGNAVFSRYYTCYSGVVEEFRTQTKRSRIQRIIYYMKIMHYNLICFLFSDNVSDACTNNFYLICSSVNKLNHETLVSKLPALIETVWKVDIPSLNI